MGLFLFPDLGYDVTHDWVEHNIQSVDLFIGVVCGVTFLW